MCVLSMTSLFICIQKVHEFLKILHFLTRIDCLNISENMLIRVYPIKQFQSHFSFIIAKQWESLYLELLVYVSSLTTSQVWIFVFYNCAYGAIDIIWFTKSLEYNLHVNTVFILKMSQMFLNLFNANDWIDIIWSCNQFLIKRSWSFRFRKVHNSFSG